MPEKRRISRMSFGSFVALYMPFKTKRDSVSPTPSHTQLEVRQDSASSHQRPINILHKYVTNAGQAMYLVQKAGVPIDDSTWELAEDLSQVDIADYEESVQRSGSETRSELEDRKSQAAEAKDEGAAHHELFGYMDHFGCVPTIEVEFRKINWNRPATLQIPHPDFLECQALVSPKSCQPLKRRRLRLDAKQNETISWAPGMPKI